VTVRRGTRIVRVKPDLRKESVSWKRARTRPQSPSQGPSIRRRDRSKPVPETNPALSRNPLWHNRLTHPQKFGRRGWGLGVGGWGKTDQPDRTLCPNPQLPGPEPGEEGASPVEAGSRNEPSFEPETLVVQQVESPSENAAQGLAPGGSGRTDRPDRTLCPNPQACERSEPQQPPGHAQAAPPRLGRPWRTRGWIGHWVRTSRLARIGFQDRFPPLTR